MSLDPARGCGKVRHEAVPIARLVPWPRNPRHISPAARRGAEPGHGKARKDKQNVQGSYFPMIRAAVERRSNYDPGTGDDDPDSAKQIFQRARQTIDLKVGKAWMLFKTDIVDSHATYRFDPDPSVTFALVFSPKA